MVNESGFEPRGRAVLVKYYGTAEQKAEQRSGLIIPEMVKERQNMLEQRAIVVAVGPAAWEDESSPRAAPGDRVMISRMAGIQARGPKDGAPYRFINDRDIFAVITCEEDHE